MRITLSIFALALAACSSAPAPSPIGSAPPALATAPAPAAEEADRPGNPPRAPLEEGALVESDKSRDPFRAYAVQQPTPPPEGTRPRKSRRFGVDQLSLVGVVTRTAEPRAMLVDPRGKGWIVAPGDLVGRPEVVGTRAVSWRVDRIREREVVLVREDAYELAAADTTRVLAMRQDATLSEDD